MVKVGVIGAGNMGEAIVSGLMKSGLKRGDVSIAEVLEERRKYMSKTYGVEVHGSAKELEVDVLFLVVKPKDALGVLRELDVPEGMVLVSSVAGLSIERIEQVVKGQVVRMMPNLACGVGEGAIAVCKGSRVSDESYRMVMELLKGLGRVVELEEELFDAVTGLSGSGPAFVLTFIEAMSGAGVKLGIPRGESLLLSAQTVLGTAKVLLESGDHPARLRDRISTPSGTTIEGLIELEKGNFRATVINAVLKAAERARELRKANP